MLVQNNDLSITLFSFTKGEEISTHESDGDATKHPHAVYGEKTFKMLLVVVF